MSKDKARLKVTSYSRTAHYQTMIGYKRSGATSAETLQNEILKASPSLPIFVSSNSSQDGHTIHLFSAENHDKAHDVVVAVHSALYPQGVIEKMVAGRPSRPIGKRSNLAFCTLNKIA